MANEFNLGGLLGLTPEQARMIDIEREQQQIRNQTSALQRPAIAQAAMGQAANIGRAFGLTGKGAIESAAANEKSKMEALQLKLKGADDEQLSRIMENNILTNPKLAEAAKVILTERKSRGGSADDNIAAIRIAMNNNKITAQSGIEAIQAERQNPGSGLAMLDYDVTENELESLTPSQILNARQQYTQDSFEAWRKSRTIDNPEGDTTLLKNIQDEQRLTSATQKAYAESKKIKDSATGMSARALSLANQLETLKPSSGIPAQVVDALKRMTGKEDQESALRAMVEQMRTESAIKRLPVGPASDKDVALVLSGELPKFANAETTAAYLRGIAKVQQALAREESRYLRYMDENKTNVGYETYRAEEDAKDTIAWLSNSEVSKVDSELFSILETALDTATSKEQAESHIRTFKKILKARYKSMNTATANAQWRAIDQLDLYTTFKIYKQSLSKGDE